jgi:hypothetical protein
VDRRRLAIVPAGQDGLRAVGRQLNSAPVRLAVRWALTDPQRTMRVVMDTSGFYGQLLPRRVVRPRAAGLATLPLGNR